MNRTFPVNFFSSMIRSDTSVGVTMVIYADSKVTRTMDAYQIAKLRHFFLHSITPFLGHEPEIVIEHKHNEFYRECRNRKWREDEMRPANWDYDEWTDTYECPEGRTLTHTGTRRRRSELGFDATTEVYECVDCGGCPRREGCFKSKDPDANKIIRVNEWLAELKRRASEMLHSERGSRLRRQRSDDVETVFGDIKRNLGFTRFLLRGLGKVTHEFRLVAAGHNIRKLALSLQADERAEARGLALSC